MTKENNINYDELLDEWAEQVFAEADKHRDMESETAVGSYKHGYTKGYAEGLTMATVILSRLEKLKGNNKE